MENVEINESIEKMDSLLNYISAIKSSKNDIKININDYDNIKYIDKVYEIVNEAKIYGFDDIVINDRDFTEEINDSFENEENDINYDTVILSVHNKDYESVPKVPEILEPWVIKNKLNDFHSNQFIIKQKNVQVKVEDKIEEKIENFSDSPKRQYELTKYLVEREKWVKRQLVIEKIRLLFNDLFSIRETLKKDDNYELVLGNGFINLKKDNRVNHPIITKRMVLKYDSLKKIIYIIDSDVDTEFYMQLFKEVYLENNTNISIQEAKTELGLNYYHPLDQYNTFDYFRRFANSISTNSNYFDHIPTPEENFYDIIIYNRPVLICRNKLNGIEEFISNIKEDIKNNKYISSFFQNIVSPKENVEISIDEIKENNEEENEEKIIEKITEFSGESKELLFTKEANREQVRIAKEIERTDTLVVQGPPGTGKTHTIANLMGHFLAQGKTVLVTSHTKKALSVLKEKLPNKIQNLCVSLLEDNNKDMVKSIDSINDYLSSHSIEETEKNITELKIEREEIFNKINKIRKKMYHIINREANSINIAGEEISPSEAAKLISSNIGLLTLIPGDVDIETPFPLSNDELNLIYMFNEKINEYSENEMDSRLPNPIELMSIYNFNELAEKYNSCINRIDEIIIKHNWKFEYDNLSKCSLVIEDLFFDIDKYSIETINEIKENLDKININEEWIKAVIIAGKRGGEYKEIWKKLILSIQEICKFSEKIISKRIGKRIVYKDKILENEDYINKYKSKNCSISLIDKIMSKDYISAIESIEINEKKISTVEDCDIILNDIKLRKLRINCSNLWDELLGKVGLPNFFDLSKEEPEFIASNYIKHIENYLDWYTKDFEVIKGYIEKLGLPINLFVSNNNLSSFVDKLNFFIKKSSSIIPVLLELLEIKLEINNILMEKDKYIKILSLDKRINSQICSKLIFAIKENNKEEYNNIFNELTIMYNIYEDLLKRNEALNKLEKYAPIWVEYIKNKNDIHGKPKVPNNIHLSWKIKQYNQIICQYHKDKYNDLQNKVKEYLEKYRKLTIEYAEQNAWCCVQKRVEINGKISNDLKGWKLNIQNIEKLKKSSKTADNKKKLIDNIKEAKKKMKNCQKTVPAWIMTINKAFETLDPVDNKFDIVIIDEASQCDISSLGIAYLGKKIIIVGDDKQVSPLAIGYKDEDIERYRELYIKEKFPNWELLDLRMSIYDIANISTKSLMLVEHFRCVPDIIGFSNMLSYDYKIKPLREANTTVLFPSMINYRVKGKYDSKKKNSEEVKKIISLMKACFEQPEYDNKTFGIISMLSGPQEKCIEEYVNKYLKEEKENRNILTGNSANFQGDERDVIFLSLVDNNIDSEKQMRMLGDGSFDLYKKRYNVAVSRAKDQLWLVHSFDSKNDLKNDDIRKRLIDYIDNPNAFKQKIDRFEAKAESPFEKLVGKALISRGYKIISQYEVGPYRIDIVVVSNEKKIAIECDGERWHHTSDQVKRDIERQNVLERVGWKFIRIRGSEYYLDEESCINKVVLQLEKYGIYPSFEKTEKVENNSDLENRVRFRASEIYNELFEKIEFNKSDLYEMNFDNNVFELLF